MKKLDSGAMGSLLKVRRGHFGIQSTAPHAAGMAGCVCECEGRHGADTVTGLGSGVSS